MKRILLSMMALACAVTGASAQEIGSEIKGETNMARNMAVVSIATPAGKANAKKKIKDNEALVGYPGSETPVGYEGWPSVADAQAVAAQIDDAKKMKILSKYTLVGMRFIVLGNLGDGAAAFTWLYGADGKAKADCEYELKEGQYDLCQLDASNQLTVKYNDVYFDTPATFEATDQAVRYGLMYTQNTDKNSKDAYPFLYGKTTEVSDGMCFLVYGTFNTKKGEGWYISANEQNPYTPCIQLIVKDSKNDTYVVGVDGSLEPTESKYYTLDGKQLSAPQKGLNIVKMSDGTTRKVVK